MKKSLIVLTLAAFALLACDPYREGRKHLREGEFEKAAQFFHAQVKKRPEDPRARNQLGLSYMKLKMNQDAERELRKAIELQPDYFEATYNLGTLLMHTRRHRGATELLQRAAELDPDSVAAHANLAWAAYNSGQIGVAGRAIRRAQELDPQAGLEELAAKVKEAEADPTKAPFFQPPPAPAAGNTVREGAASP